MKLAILSTALVGSTAAFPALLNLNGKDKLLDLSVIDLNVKTEEKNTYAVADPKNCPYNPNHVPAAAWDPKFPYGGAKNGLSGTGKGGYVVPHPDDVAHKFIAPGPLDIRGP
jgi:hypothetical protein